jgi:hypothetical protein
VKGMAPISEHTARVTYRKLSPPLVGGFQFLDLSVSVSGGRREGGARKGGKKIRSTVETVDL